jgi:hypothetical protein
MELQLSPCEECGVKFISGKGWVHTTECEHYDPPREMTYDDFADLFGDLDPELFV